MRGDDARQRGEMPDNVAMRAILIGPDRDRDRLRWQVRDTGLVIVGECATVVEARESGIASDVLLLTPGASTADERGARRASRAPLSAAAEPDARQERLSPVGPLEPLASTEALTPRELEVLGRLADGLPNKAIAAEFGISDQTVKFHVAQIIAKLGVANRTEAVRRAIRQGLVAV